MKKFTTTWTLALVVMFSFALMSCQDDDERIAYYLDGVWRGSITEDESNTLKRWYQTTIEFFQDDYYAVQGYGYETSTWSHGHTTRTYFEWWVRDKIIYLHYSDSHQYIIMECNRLPRTSKLYEELTGRFVDYDTDYVMADFWLQKDFNHDEYAPYNYQ